MKKPISTSVVFIPEADPPVFFQLPTFLTRATLKQLQSKSAASDFRFHRTECLSSDGEDDVLPAAKAASADIVDCNKVDNSL